MEKRRIGWWNRIWGNGDTFDQKMWDDSMMMDGPNSVAGKERSGSVGKNKHDCSYKWFVWVFFVEILDVWKSCEGSGVFSHAVVPHCIVEKWCLSLRIGLSQSACLPFSYVCLLSNSLDQMDFSYTIDRLLCLKATFTESATAADAKWLFSSSVISYIIVSRPYVRPDNKQKSFILKPLIHWVTIWLQEMFILIQNPIY